MHFQCNVLNIFDDATRMNAKIQHYVNPNTIRIAAIDCSIRSNNSPGTIMDILKQPQDERDTAGLYSFLDITVGSQVMLTKNLDDSLANGSLGYVSAIHLGNPSENDFVHVVFDN